MCEMHIQVQRMQVLSHTMPCDYRYIMMYSYTIVWLLQTVPLNDPFERNNSQQPEVPTQYALYSLVAERAHARIREMSFMVRSTSKVANVICDRTSA
jgi:hypothetical protein